jgi:carboxypeptidase Q
MRLLTRLTLAALGAASLFHPAFAAEDSAADEKMLRAIYDAALTNSPMYGNLRELVTKYPGRLSGSKSLEGAVLWGEAALKAAGADRTELQPVMVPHWDRGAQERVAIAGGGPLAAAALGNSAATPASGLTAPVVELHSLDALKTADVRGKIVFFNRLMNPVHVAPGKAYGEAIDQRGRGPAEAVKYGAVAVLVRSMTHTLDDFPHTGNTTFPPDSPRLPAAALSTVAADRLSAALKKDPATRVTMTINARTLPDAQSHNVLGEIRGSEFPDKVIVVGGHLDSWDIAPGAHDDGAGIVQSIEVLRLLKAAGHQPRHTIRAVLFTNEENGVRGAAAYSTLAKERNEFHVLAIESDGGGHQPRGFNLGNPAGDAHLKAARWLKLFEPYGIHYFQAGRGATDVAPLLAHGATIAGLQTDTQRYFDIHHTAADSLDKVNARELELGAAAMAALVYLVDKNGL